MPGSTKHNLSQKKILEGKQGEVPENERVSAQGFVETTRRIRRALYDQERVVRFAKLVYVPHLALKLITPN